MKVKILLNLGTREFPDTPYQAGEEPNVSRDLGELLIRRGLAVDITPAPKKAPGREAGPAAAEEIGLAEPKAKRSPAKPAPSKETK